MDRLRQRLWSAARGGRRSVLVAAAVLAASGAALPPPAGGSAGVPSRPAFAWGAARQGPAVRASLPARPSLCTAGRRPGSYPWPLKPFGEQHPIRAFFGDPRTIFRSAGDAHAGTFSFHNGVDIVADDGTSVYPVVSGTVTRVGPDEISVSSEAGARIFQYWHLVPRVHLHGHVRAQKTVLGTVQQGRGHVHLSEIEDGVVENPLQPGHLTPYRDNTAPSVEELYVRDRLGRTLNPESLTGTVDLTAAAADTPPLPLPAPWSGVSVTPARVSWQLATLPGHELLVEQTSADFSLTIPLADEFWRVYDEGTYQNFPTVGARYFYGTPGDYLFNLTPTPLDTKLLPPGRYTLTVAATDTCGNRGTLAEEIRILPQPGATPITGVVLQTLAAHGNARPAGWPHRFWTIVLATLPGTEGLLPAQDLAGHVVDGRLLPVGLVAISTARNPHPGRDLLVTGVFHRWADAYVAAQRVTPSFPGAYAREIVQRRQSRDWPREARRGRYTVVLASLPVRAGQASALELSRAVTRQGLPSVHVLHSARFTTLRPGYIVVASGRYPTAEAAGQAARLDATFYGNAYVRELIARKTVNRNTEKTTAQDSVRRRFSAN